MRTERRVSPCSPPWASPGRWSPALLGAGGGISAGKRCFPGGTPSPGAGAGKLSPSLSLLCGFCGRLELQTAFAFQPLKSPPPPAPQSTVSPLPVKPPPPANIRAERGMAPNRPPGAARSGGSGEGLGATPGGPGAPGPSGMMSRRGGTDNGS